MALGIQNLLPNPPTQNSPLTARLAAGTSPSHNRELGLMSPGTAIVPPSIQTPGILALLAKEFRMRGQNPSSYVVGSPSVNHLPPANLPDYSSLTPTPTTWYNNGLGV